MRKLRSGAIAAPWVCALLLACGGGGGGSGVNVTSDKSSLTFVGFSHALPSSQNVTFTLVSGSGSFYAEILLDAPDLFDATFTPSGYSGVVTLTPLATAAGTVRSGAFVFRLCRDEACGDVAWSKSIPYALAVYSVEDTGVSLGGYEGVGGAARALAVSPADAQGQLSVAVTDGAGWLAATHTTAGAIDLAASGVGLTAGSYQGTVTVSFPGHPGAPQLGTPARPAPSSRPSSRAGRTPIAACHCGRTWRRSAGGSRAGPVDAAPPTGDEDRAALPTGERIVFRDGGPVVAGGA